MSALTESNLSAYIVRSKNVFFDSISGSKPAALIVRDKKIARVTAFDEDFSKTPIESTMKIFDFGDLTIMPGVVDTHAHINEPGRTDWEGFRTATRAAAAGGITTVIDMPLNSIPPTTTLKNMQVKMASAAGQCAIDYGLWGGIIPGNIDELEGMIQAGICGFKVFLIESGVDEFPMVREEDLRAAMPVLAKAGVPLLVHAELEGDVDVKMPTSANKYQGYLSSRPQSWEVNAIRKIIRLAAETKCHAHIVHLSAADALTELKTAREKGVPITVETCPHYLSFTAEEIADGATHFKCAPPIRERENQERLWSALQAQLIDMIVSDHSPCTPHLKLLDKGDFEHAWGGISGIQFSMPVIWTEMKKRGLGLELLIRWMCEKTADFSGFKHRKGRLAQGYDADFVVWDPNASYALQKEMIFHKHDLSPYVGKTLFGKIHKTFVGGQCVFDSNIFRSQALGEFLKRGY